MARDTVTVPREDFDAACDRLQMFLDTFGDLGDCVTQADIDDWRAHSNTLAPPPSSDPEGGARGEVWLRHRVFALTAALRLHDDYMSEQFSGPESDALHPKAAANWRNIRDVLASATKSDGGAEATGAPVAAPEVSGTAPSRAQSVGERHPSDQLTKTPSADHDDGNLRSLAEPNHQPHAVSQGWRTDLENARDGTKVDVWVNPSRGALSGTGGARVPDCWFSEGKWWLYDETKYATDAANCRSEVWGVTHWMPLPAPPSPAKTGGAS